MMFTRLLWLSGLALIAARDNIDVLQNHIVKAAPSALSKHEHDMLANKRVYANVDQANMTLNKTGSLGNSANQIGSVGNATIQTGSHGNGTVSCTVQNCAACATDVGKCDSCMDGYQLKGAVCNPWECTTTDEGAGCRTCAEPAQRTAENHCASCNDLYVIEGTTCALRLGHLVAQVDPNVRLAGARVTVEQSGNTTTGTLQIYGDTPINPNYPSTRWWSVLVDTSKDMTELPFVMLACRQFGYQSGTARFDMQTVGSTSYEPQCEGEETSIAACPLEITRCNVRPVILSCTQAEAPAE